MAIIFDGRSFAKEKEKALQSRVRLLRKNKIIPKLVSIVIGDVDGAMKYQEMKKRQGERVGIEIEIKQFKEKTAMSEILQFIGRLNKDTSVHGIMIQLPLPQSFAFEDRAVLINAIDLKKDVDGMNERSDFIAPVVMAVLNAFQKSKIQNPKSKWGKKPHFAKATLGAQQIKNVAVVGAEGFEGKKIVKAFQAWGYSVTKLDRKNQNAVFINHEISHADVVVSCTGSPASIVGEVIKPNAIVIDVGAPQGDFEFESVSKKASFITPVPGGIGPVTIISLMENVVEAAHH
jgi:methylenetetrahydrofolate dehydrogenase (NADP+)/methenyltetrahydrofolate cyclohydrolase